MIAEYTRAISVDREALNILPTPVPLPGAPPPPLRVRHGYDGVEKARTQSYPYLVTDVSELRAEVSQYP